MATYRYGHLYLVAAIVLGCVVLGISLAGSISLTKLLVSKLTAAFAVAP